MKRIIEVEEVQTLPAVANKSGFYVLANAVYAASAIGVPLLYVGQLDQLTSAAPEQVQQPSGVTETTLLKAIAVAQNPELISSLV